MPPTRAGGAAGQPTQTSAALTSGRGCRPLASPRSPTGSCSAETWSHRALMPHTSATAKCARGGRGVSRASVPGAQTGAEVRLPLPTASRVVASSSSPGMLRRALGALLLHRVVSARLAVSGHARTAAPSPSSPGNDFQFTWRLSRLPRGRVA